LSRSRLLETPSRSFPCVQITPQDQFLVLACDGVFDVLTSEEVVSNVYEKMKIHADAQRFDGWTDRWDFLVELVQGVVG
ncbi:unnamed protein product, partial [Hapterophycus canaliculatus]